MSPDRSKIVSRILKLFSLGDASRNASEEEVMAAVTAAKRLMAEHDIAMAEVERLASKQAARPVTIDLTEEPSYTLRQKFARYDDYVAQAVEVLCHVRSLTYARTTLAGTFYIRTFVGTVADVAVAKELFTILLFGMRRLARVRFGSGWGHKHNSYCDAYGAKLYWRAKEADPGVPEDKQQTYAMVVYSKETALAQWMADKGVKEGKERKRKKQLDYEAVQAGLHDASRVSLDTRGVGAKKETPR